MMIEVFILAAIVFAVPFFVSHLINKIHEPKQIKSKPKPNYDWIYDFEIEVWGWSHIPREFLSSHKRMQINQREIYNKRIANQLDIEVETAIARRQAQLEYERRKPEIDREYEQYKRETHKSKELVPYYPKTVPARAYHSRSTGKSYSADPVYQELKRNPLTRSVAMSQSEYEYLMTLLRNGMIGPQDIVRYLNDRRSQ